MITKICPRCKTTKPLSDFGDKKCTKDGKQYHCKACMTLVAKEHRLKKRKEEKERRLAELSMPKIPFKEQLKKENPDLHDYIYSNHGVFQYILKTDHPKLYNKIYGV